MLPRLSNDSVLIKARRQLHISFGRYRHGVVSSPSAHRSVSDVLSSGGFKTSGIGREGGPKSLDMWLEEKSMIIKVKGF